MPRGDILIPMDIDLQDPPELFGPFIARWREGYDIVYGVRQPRAWDTMSKRLSAELVLLGVQPHVAGAHPGQCRRLPPGRPPRRRGAAPAARAQPLHEGPVRLGRLQRDRRALRAAAARRGLEQVQPVAAVELRARRRGELLDRAAARLVLRRPGDRGGRRALRPVHHRPRADLRHRHARLCLAVDRRPVHGRHPARCRSASSASISAACSSR